MVLFVYILNEQHHTRSIDLTCVRSDWIPKNAELSLEAVFTIKNLYFELKPKKEE